MTVSTSQSSEIFLGNGATNTFTFSFIGVAAEDIQVIYSNPPSGPITLLPSQYTLFLNPAAAGSLWGVGGTVTYPVSGSPIPDGSTLTISRILPLTQTTSISNQGNFYPQAIEQALDKLEMQIQQTSDRTVQWRGTWTTDTSYTVGDIVQDGINGADTGNYYMCILANTSGTWSTDLTNGDWQLIIDSAAIGPIGVVYGTTDRITVTNPTTTPTIDIASTYVGQTSITTLGTVITGTWNSALGTITTGTWNATTIAVNHGGTGQTTYTDGQLLIGNSSGNTLSKATLTAGTNILITNAGGSITISQSSTTPFTKSFFSAQQTITAAGALTLAHGMATIPRLLQVTLVCQTGEGGYTAGDILLVPTSYTDTSAGNQYGASVVPDATNLNIRYGSYANTWFIPRKDNGNEFGITNANWKAVFSAWA